MTASPDAFEVIGVVTQDANTTFNELMRRHPKTHSKAERLSLIHIQRANRAAYEAKRDAKKEPKDE